MFKKWFNQPSKLDPEFTRGQILELRWIMWHMKWFPYRTYTILNMDNLDEDIQWSPAIWNRPDILWRLKRRA